ncbi:MAG TPA: imidazoleglycerol-phosphate dehydratase HisB [Actinomycetota bacterium]|jgi:imidazoleglycerol-phosphate dehydratase|nr:imidazoleglycerol-phosphate dehydratase HisB [Actinomycetota bacterium]
MSRVAEVDRKTNETSIRLRLDLDGSGTTEISTGVGFFDHMLDQLGRHWLVDLEIDASGDLHVDAHHTVEDVGICLGTALNEALGEKRGIRRYGWSIVPMEEALVQSALDLSGRPLLVFDAPVPAEAIGNYDPDLTEEFFTALSRTAGITLHIRLLAGKNSHHIVEAVFKSVAQALKVATELDARRGSTVPSTKGVL